MRESYRVEKEVKIDFVVKEEDTRVAYNMFPFFHYHCHIVFLNSFVNIRSVWGIPIEEKDLEIALDHDILAVLEIQHDLMAVIAKEDVSEVESPLNLSTNQLPPPKMKNKKARRDAQ